MNDTDPKDREPAGKGTEAYGGDQDSEPPAVDDKLIRGDQEEEDSDAAEADETESTEKRKRQSDN
ncbi:MAG TPA: hypothetical protein VGO66_08705 [Solirubrobacterales bacterium]|jgi:hypothetical protein|nr:hypothetical protein [Solirubrobacterales bacterium]